MGAEFKIRLTRVNVNAEPINTINTECGYSDSTKSIGTHLIPRVLSRFVNGEQRQDNDVLTAITVRKFPPHLKDGP